jgi:hypothetical protein
MSCIDLPEGLIGNAPRDPLAQRTRPGFRRHPHYAQFGSAFADELESVYLRTLYSSKRGVIATEVRLPGVQPSEICWLGISDLSNTLERAQ